MPQTDHLLVGMHRVSSAPCLQPPHALSVPISPALSHKGCLTGRSTSTTKTHPQRHKTVTFQNSNSSETVIKSDKEEKNLRFQLRWELQLSASVLICFLIGLVIPFSMIIIGGVYVFECPQEVMIPVFLIVCGSSFLLSVYGLREMSSRKTTPSDISSYRSALWTAVLLQIGWFIAGCYWIYGTYPPNYDDSGASPYCNKTLYQFAFWMLNSIFILAGVAVFAFVAFVAISFQTGTSTPSPV